MGLKVNRNLKHVCFDSIGQDDRCTLFVRTVILILTVTINMTSVKFFDCTLVAVVNTFNPFCTMILAAIFLHERLVCGRVAQLLICLGGTLLLILYTPAPESSEEISQEEAG